MELPDKIIKFCETRCRQSQDPFFGQLIKLQDWQKDWIQKQYGNWDGERIKYKRSGIWIPKKNGKTTFLAGIALFNALWKPGNQILIVSPTVKQSKVMFREMEFIIAQDPDLSKCFHIQSTLNTITDKKTGSIIQIVAASPKVSGPSAGLIIFEEAAEIPLVYAQTILEKTRDAGKAKKYSHQISISTANFDLQSPFYEEFKYALGVQQGTIEDENFLPLVYTVPNNTGDEWMNIDEVVKANPACGVIWEREDLERDLAHAIKTPSRQGSFRTLICNQWLHSANTWIDIGQYDRCKVDKLPEASTYSASFDLSTNRDLSCFLVASVVDRMFFVEPYFWMPQSTAEEYDEKFRTHFVRMASDSRNNLELTPGDVIDYDRITEKILEVLQDKFVQGVYYDKHKSSNITQRLDREAVMLCPVSQAAATVTAPIMELERKILCNEFCHDGNEVLRFCFENACLKPSPDGLVRLQKPTKDDYRKIDGAACAVMGLMPWLRDDAFYSISPVR